MVERLLKRQNESNNGFNNWICLDFSYGQSDSFEKINFILGEWNGEGSGFGSEKSKIESSFKLIMGGQYIEVQNKSKFCSLQ